MMPLQVRGLDFIRDRIERTGFAPTLGEIAEELSLASASDLVNALVRMGKLTKERGKARGLSVAGAADLTLVGTCALRAELARRGETMEALEAIPVRAGRCCAANGCPRLVRPGMLMCRDHWFALPPHLCMAIKSAFARKDEAAYQENFARAVDMLDRARGHA